MDTIDFGIKRTQWLILVVAILIFSVPFSAIGSLLLSVVRQGGLTAVEMLFIAGVAGILIGIAIALYASLRHTGRFRFSDDGVRVRALFGGGERYVPWSAVERARLSLYKRTITLRLDPREQRRVSIHLSQFGRSRHLYDEIERRLPVAVEGNPALADRLRDE